MADNTRPTPTQDENDRAALGEHVLTKQDDGSGPPITVWPPVPEEPSPPPEDGGDEPEDGDDGGTEPDEPDPPPPEGGGEARTAAPEPAPPAPSETRRRKRWSHGE